VQQLEVFGRLGRHRPPADDAFSSWSVSIRVGLCYVSSPDDAGGAGVKRASSSRFRTVRSLSLRVWFLRIPRMLAQASRARISLAA